MAAQYVTITKNDIDSVLTTRGFTHTPLDKSLEYIYDKKVSQDGACYTVRIFTSVDVRTNTSRDKGSDAIRIIVLNDRNKVISKETRVNRSEGWQYRLNARIDSWSNTLNMCPQCQKGMLVRRKGKWGSFYGCTEYPRCGYITTKL